MTIGKRIKEIRGKETREEFSAQVGIHPQTLYRYETGDRAVDSNLIATLCQKYNILSNWLIFGEGPMRPDEDAPAPQTPSSTPQNTGRIAALEARVALLEEVLRSRDEMLKAKEDALRAKDETLKAKDEALAAYKQIADTIAASVAAC